MTDNLIFMLQNFLLTYFFSIPTKKGCTEYKILNLQFSKTDFNILAFGCTVHPTSQKIFNLEAPRAEEKHSYVIH